MNIPHSIILHPHLTLPCYVIYHPVKLFIQSLCMFIHSFLSITYPHSYSSSYHLMHVSHIYTILNLYILFQLDISFSFFHFNILFYLCARMLPIVNILVIISFILRTLHRASHIYNSMLFRSSHTVPFVPSYNLLSYCS